MMIELTKSIRSEQEEKRKMSASVSVIRPKIPSFAKIDIEVDLRNVILLVLTWTNSLNAWRLLINGRFNAQTSSRKLVRFASGITFFVD